MAVLKGIIVMNDDFDAFEKWLYSDDGLSEWNKAKKESYKNRKHGVRVDQTPHVSLDEQRLLFILSEYHRRFNTR